MTANLNRIQNDDGSWTGHHCITGRTFCTSTALLVLLVIEIVCVRLWVGGWTGLV